MTAAPPTVDIQPKVDFRTHPSQYRHWRLSIDGAIATLAMDVAEEGGLRPGYKLKLNSYDLGVDIELHDALQRIRFEHPTVRTVIITSLKDRIFCSGANIFMLGLSSHAWKVNFCKFTNETRNGMEDSSRHDGLRFVAAINGACAGGGYELALACDDIILVDDRSSSVALPEVPLLGVLPGTGGLTRVTDKRKVRHDRADVFCTLVEGIRGQRAKDWRLVDEIAKPANFQAVVRERAEALAETSDRPSNAQGVSLSPLQRDDHPDGVAYRYVKITIDRDQRCASWTLRGPDAAAGRSLDDVLEEGDAWWPLQFARELDDAILHMRTNELEIGSWVFRAEGDSGAMQAMDAFLSQHDGHWLVRETIGLLRRALARLDVSSRSLFALIEPGSCFVGTLLEIALACDRSYMLDDPDAAPGAEIILSTANFGRYPMVTGLSRLARRFSQEAGSMNELEALIGKPIGCTEAESIGLVTMSPDSLDWDDEIRIMLEERRALSPDALTGMEANLRFGGSETMETRIFGRLSAWQNWIFTRPNAAGEKGALTLYGKGEQPGFDWTRV